PLTRVTRIFQKSIFTKTTRAGPAAAVAGFLLRACERRRCGFGWGLKGTTWGLGGRMGGFKPRRTGPLIPRNLRLQKWVAAAASLFPACYLQGAVQLCRVPLD